MKLFHFSFALFFSLNEVSIPGQLSILALRLDSVTHYSSCTYFNLGMMAYTCDPSTQTEAGGLT